MWTLPLIAEAKPLITWTPTTFYVTAFLFQTIGVYLVGKILGIDAEHNNPIALAICMGIANAVAFFVRDMGVVGILISSATFVVLLLGVSAVDILMTVVGFLVALGIYGVLGGFLIDRTPDTLTAETIGGLPKVVITGEIEAEPVDRVPGSDKKEGVPEY